MRQPTLFESARLQMTAALQMTIESMQAYGPRFRHWAIAWSGGKDSSALLTLICYLIDSGKISAPESLTVCYADTRMELTPLAAAALDIMHELRERKIDVRIAMAPLDKRFMVYMFGRGVPPPNNNTFRWCTRQIKIDPMKAELERVHQARGEKLLMLTGVRQGESAIRDGRIEMSCSKDGAECGQGWYQQTLPGAFCDTLAPLLHWRVCHVWEWLKHWAPLEQYGDWSTAAIADAYGGDEAEEVNARTGCVGCALASRDTALETVIRVERFAYLAPLLGLKPLYRWLRLPAQRLRKPGGETRGDGTPVKNQQRMGPLTIAARRAGLARVLEIQETCNAAARQLGRPLVDLINLEELARINELIAANTYPNKWDGTEPGADEPMDTLYADGTAQPLLLQIGKGKR